MLGHFKVNLLSLVSELGILCIELGLIFSHLIHHPMHFLHHLLQILGVHAFITTQILEILDFLSGSTINLELWYWHLEVSTLWSWWL